MHAVDLAAGTGFADRPRRVCEALVTDIARWRDAKANGPALAMTDGTRTRHVEVEGEPRHVTGAAPELAA